MLKRIVIGLVVLVSLPFVALAVAVGYLLFAEWRERMTNPPTTTM
jgi:EamA domain-containing membrane protein RarD